ncbi:unnamed protein product [Mycena citricolor]|uniref:Uncharacterized protein n=1 Tax=Mycena citricolor TaxID=2018698 RepID=A0AAD2GW72_9AGAR|nr:unnamed protein product [Mycena citricolor]
MIVAALLLALQTEATALVPRATGGYVQNPSGTATFTHYSGCGQPACGRAASGYSAAISQLAFGSVLAWELAIRVAVSTFAKTLEAQQPFSLPDEAHFWAHSRKSAAASGLALTAAFVEWRLSERRERVLWPNTGGCGNKGSAPGFTGANVVAANPAPPPAAPPAAKPSTTSTSTQQAAKPTLKTTVSSNRSTNNPDYFHSC